MTNITPIYKDILDEERLAENYILTNNVKIQISEKDLAILRQGSSFYYKVGNNQWTEIKHLSGPRSSSYFDDIKLTEAGHIITENNQKSEILEEIKKTRLSHCNIEATQSDWNEYQNYIDNINHINKESPQNPQRQPKSVRTYTLLKAFNKKKNIDGEELNNFLEDHKNDKISLDGIQIGKEGHPTTLKDIDFSDCSINHSKIIDCNLDNVVFKNCDLSHTQIKNSKKYLDKDSIEKKYKPYLGATFTKCICAFLEISGYTFSKRQLIDCNLEKTTFVNCDLTEVEISSNKKKPTSEIPVAEAIHEATPFKLTTRTRTPLPVTKSIKSSDPLMDELKAKLKKRNQDSESLAGAAPVTKGTTESSTPLVKKPEAEHLTTRTTSSILKNLDAKVKTSFADTEANRRSDQSPDEQTKSR